MPHPRMHALEKDGSQQKGQPRENLEGDTKRFRLLPRRLTELQFV